MLNINKKISGLMISLLITLSGCSTVGLSNVANNRENYNVAMNRSDNEQFLLNLVRMYYNKTPFFLSVDSVTTQTSLNYTTGGADTWFGNSYSGFGIAWQMLPQITFTQSPTITYSPMQGSSYVSGLLTPITVLQTYALLETNLDNATVMKLVFDHIGPIVNGDQRSFISSPNPALTSKYNKFVEWLSEQEHADKIDILLTSYMGDKALLLNCHNQEIAQEMASYLQLKKPHKKIILSTNINIQNNPDYVVKIGVRSFFSVLNFLSANVVEANTNSGVVSPLTIYMSNSEPVRTINKIEYDGKWYYISNNDINSKTTFMILKLLFALQSGDVTNNWTMVEPITIDE